MKIGFHRARSYLVRPNWFLWTGLAVGFFMTTLLRSIKSIRHLPPDPGLEFQLLARADSLSRIFSSHNGYPQVLPRLLSEALNLVPLSQLTYWSTLTNALISMICAVAIVRALLEFVDLKIAAIVGIVFATSFAAHEGLIGNVWAIRWMLLSTACIVASVPSFVQKYWRFSLVLFLATGLSHAYVFVPACAFIFSALLRRDLRRKTIVIGVILVGLSTFQLFGFLNSSRQIRLYGDQTYYVPWVGAGVFWWAVFTLPLGFGLVAVILSSNQRNFSSRNLSPQFVLGCQALLLGVLSYLQLGIKSSPAVTTINVSFAAFLAAAQGTSLSGYRAKLNKIIMVSGSIVVLALSIRYFLPSYYLTNGAGWPDVVEMSVKQCRETDAESVDLLVFQSGDLMHSENLSCKWLADWDQWFFSR